MELTRSIDFSAKKHIKKPTSINENKTIFVLYASEKTVLRPGEAKVIKAQIKLKLQHTINAKNWHRKHRKEYVNKRFKLE